MKKVTSGNIINIGNYEYNPKTGKGANNLTYQEWDHLYSVYTNFTELKGHFARTYCYDSLWAVAVALDNARKGMIELGKQWSSFKNVNI